MLAVLLCLCVADSPFPAELTQFRPGRQTAVHAEEFGWASAIRERGAIVELPNGKLRLYFTGYDGTREGLKRIGYVESNNGGVRWGASSDPVTPPGLWAEDPYVFYDGTQYQMFTEGRGDEPHRLSSTDGIEWMSHGPLTVRRTDGTPIKPPIGTPVVVRHQSRWHLLYEQRDSGIWLAASDDLQTWTNVSDEAVFRPSEAGFDSAMIAFNQVVERDGQYYVYYHGTDRRQKPRSWAVGVAVSDDLQEWTRFEGNPITDPASNRSSPWLVGNDSKQPILFTTHGTVEMHPPRQEVAE